MLTTILTSDQINDLHDVNRHRTPRMTQRYAHLSPQYMAGAVGKLDSVSGEVMPQNGSGDPQYVTIASPDFRKVEHDNAKLLN